MCDMCDNPSLTPADMRARTIRSIENFGWMIQYVEPDPYARSLAYTVGLTGLDLPEIYSIGLSAEVAGELLNRVAELCVAGIMSKGSHIYGPDDTVYVLGRGTAQGLYVARDVYGKRVRALKLVAQ